MVGRVSREPCWIPAVAGLILLVLVRGLGAGKGNLSWVSKSSMTVSGWDLRREDTTSRLRQIALELFVRRGYANVSVDDIAAAAGVSARTFHRYFPSKQDVLLQRRAEMDQRVIDRL